MFSAGTAKVCINPLSPCEMSGFAAREGEWQDIHDSLWVKSFVLVNEDSTFVLLSLDVIGLDFSTIQKIKDTLTRKYGLNIDSILISTTHTHAGPATLENANLGKVNKQYLEQIIEQCSVCVHQALSNMEAVELKFGKGSCPEVGKNRRDLNGITDPDVLVLSIYRKCNNQLQTVIVNYTCHPTVLGPKNLYLSADYPYYLYEVIENVYNKPNVLFINGAAGNINVGHHASDSISGKAGNIRTFSQAKKHGYTLAAEVLKAIEHSEAIDDFSLLIQQVNMNLTISSHDIARAVQKEITSIKQVEKATLTGGNLKMLEVKECWIERWRDTTHQDFHIEFSILIGKIGPTLFVTLPGEFFVELGLSIKKAFPQQSVFIFGYSNGNLGYVPNKASYPHGGYEIDEAFQMYNFPAPFPIETGEKIITTAITVLNRLQTNDTPNKE